MSAKNFNPSWHMEVGINNVPAYQVSGEPFASGNINATSATQKLSFPYVTRWVEVYNAGNSSLKVGFSKNGLELTNNYFQIPPSSSSGRLELKISEIYTRGGHAGLVSVVAGLTSIKPEKVALSGSTGPKAMPNWSGSFGVG